MTYTATTPMISPASDVRHPNDLETDEDTPQKFWESYRLEGDELDEAIVKQFMPLAERAQGLGGNVDINYIISCLHDALGDACDVPVE